MVSVNALAAPIVILGSNPRIVLVAGNDGF
jgi:hypothetical protein